MTSMGVQVLSDADEVWVALTARELYPDLCNGVGTGPEILARAVRRGLLRGRVGPTALQGPAGALEKAVVVDAETPV